MTHAEFTEAYQQSHRRLSKICRMWLSRVDLGDSAEDVVQRVFMEFTRDRKYESLTPEIFESMLPAMVRRRAGDLVRDHYGRLDRGNRGTNAGERLGFFYVRQQLQALSTAKDRPNTDLEIAIADAIAALTDQQREIAQRYYIEDEKGFQLAKDLGLSHRQFWADVAAIRSTFEEQLKRFDVSHASHPYREGDSETLEQMVSDSAEMECPTACLTAETRETDQQVASGIRDRMKAWRASRAGGSGDASG